MGAVLISFLVDTGAAVSLIHGDIWDKIKPYGVPKADPVSARLVGVDGAPLQVRGSVMVQLVIAGQSFQQRLIIADSLMSKGILGLDFLECNQCVLNLAQEELLTHGKSIPLVTQPTKELVARQVEIMTKKTFTIAAVSEMEIIGKIHSACEGTWLMEDKQPKKA